MIKAFENGIVKLQRGDPPSREEANAVQIFKLDQEASVTTYSPSMGFVERILCTQDDGQKRRKIASQYYATAHVSPTSNACERFLVEQSF